MGHTTNQQAEPLMSAQAGQTGELVAALKVAFGQGISSQAAACLVGARDSGLGWEDATQAVAEGIAARYGFATCPSPPGRHVSQRVWRGVALSVALYALARPALGIAHQVTVATVARLVHALVFSNVWAPPVARLPLDPVYTDAVIQAVGGVEVRGVAVAEPTGSFLHAWLPHVFLADPLSVVAGASASLVAVAGAPTLGRAVAVFGADVTWLALGMLLWSRARHRHVTIASVGVLIQAQVAIHHLLATRISPADLDATGLPFALSVLSTDRNDWFTARLAQVDPMIQAVMAGIISLCLGYVTAWTFVKLLTCAGRILRGAARVRGHRRRPVARRPSLVPFAAVALVAIITAMSPVGSLGRGRSNWWLGRAHAATLPHRSGPFGLFGQTASDVPPGPRATPVSIQPDGSGGWTYLVDGQPTVIRGVGYNPQYASLATADRQRLYDRDFGAMNQLGINTVDGWFQDQFDEVTLQSAASNGIGVLLPFELNQDWNYADPAVQAQTLDDVSVWVERYKDSPALRMWAPGNEDLHRILYPNWVSRADDPTARAQATAFAAFLPVLADRIHQLDPSHPVIYRDAEDLYLARLKTPLEQSGGSRPWLVYGANVYSLPRLQQIVQSWPSQWLNGPLVISEFAANGVSGDARADGYQQDWAAIRSRPGVVLGGLAYAWATNGPEQLDRLFGLVNADGVPTDSALGVLSGAYLADTAAGQ